ncbi:DUF4836 family protein [Aridibaculum aurantiacum]|uniref:DUF4836 family protein n=1 Tax=Aridibaculum aurantiacum TaxID=2810307 RepID=UPI001A97A562|nr:DUF4836 family protein [Aridibaculum aurantiacum]
MKSITRLSLLLLLSAAVFTSCKKSAPKQTRHIPKNAVFVAAINTKAITNKLAKSQATVENLFKSFSKDDTTVSKGKKEWEEFQNSGIDLSENFYVSVVQKSGGMGMAGGNSIVAGIGGLKDAGKMEAYVKKKQPNAEIRKEKDYSYANVEGNSIVAWGNDLVLVMTANQNAGMQMEFDSTTGEYNFKQPANTGNDLKSEVAAYFAMKEDQSIASIPEFRDLMQENADGSFWVNSTSSLENMPIPLPKVKELIENSFTAATLNFEDGKVVVETRSYSSPALSNILKKYAGPTVDLNMVERYPSKNINGFMAFAFNPGMINDIIMHLEVKGVADQYLSNALGGQYTVEDVAKAIKGDMAVVVSDFTMPQVDPATGMPKTASPMRMVLNVPVGDKAQMNRLMDKLVEMGLMVKQGNEYRATEAISRTGYQVVVDDKNLLAASDAELLAQYKAGNAKAGISNDIMGDFKGKNAAFYVNIESILNQFPAEGGPNAVMPQAKATFRDAKGHADNFNGKYTAGHFELRMKNEKENSLVSLVQFLSSVGHTFSNPANISVDDVELEELEPSKTDTAQ